MRARFVGNWRKLEKTALEPEFTREDPREENPVNIGFPLEPVVGIEPTTYGLRNRCSTTELHRLKFNVYRVFVRFD